DCLLDGDDRLHGPGKGKLHWPSHLPTVDACGHNGPEHPDVEERLAHPLTRVIYVLLVFTLFYVGKTQRRIGTLMLSIQNGLFFDVDVVPFRCPSGRRVSLRETNEIADFAFEADICH